LHYMSKSGCKRIYYGIESASELILSNIKKEIDLNKVKRAINLTRKNNIKSLGFFMLGNPGETIESIKDTIRLSKKLKLDYVQFMRTIPKPCSNLDNGIKKDGGYDYWRNYIKGDVEEKRIKNHFCNLPEDVIDKQIKKAYLSFYLNPLYIIKTIFEIKSFKKLNRYIKTGFKMIYSTH